MKKTNKRRATFIPPNKQKKALILLRFEMYFEIYKENDLNKTFFCQQREKFPHSDRKFFVSPRSEQKNQAHIIITPAKISFQW